MDEYLSEKEQVEELKKIWNQHGAFILAGLILGMAVLGGWRYWKQYRLDRAATASTYYEELSVAIAGKDASGAADLYDTLSAKYSATPYVAQAALAMARMAVEGGELEQAEQYLRTALEQSRDEQLTLVVHLRLARVLLALDRAEEALTVLDVAQTGNFAGRFHEARGDVYAAMGRSADARGEYQSALDKFEPGLFDRRVVEMKLNDLAVADRPADPGA